MSNSNRTTRQRRRRYCITADTRLLTYALGFLLAGAALLVVGWRLTHGAA